MTRRQLFAAIAAAVAGAEAARSTLPLKLRIG